MTRKDYIKLADALLSAHNETRTQETRETVELTASYIADVLARDNPRFDRQRFLTASGVQP